jgi:hypothetical protein|tara:strand:- start:839 stop:1039 length:201 start_codon:yes stop_codon:yes gene_type:complete
MKKNVIIFTEKEIETIEFLAVLKNYKQLTLTDVSNCDNPHCVDGVVDGVVDEIYEEKIYCSNCEDK